MRPDSNQHRGGNDLEWCSNAEDSIGDRGRVNERLLVFGGG